MLAPQGVAGTFELRPALQQVVLRLTGNPTGASTWLQPGAGVWHNNDNWSLPPLDDPGTPVLFGLAPGSATAITLNAPATIGSALFDAPFNYTVAGNTLTLGAAGAPGKIKVAQGVHEIASALAVPDRLDLTLKPNATLRLAGGASGDGGITAGGGGTLELAGGQAWEVPLALDGGTLAAADTMSTALDLTLAGAPVVLHPAQGKTVTFSGSIDGSGTLIKEGASIVELIGSDSGAGKRVVRNGTLVLNSLDTLGDLEIGAGTLKYTGPSVTLNKGLHLDTQDDALAATFESDADVTFNGSLTVKSGSFMKFGDGTITFAGPGANRFGVGYGKDGNTLSLDRGTFGESPTRGFVQAFIGAGKLVIGAPDQSNIFTLALIVGGQSTTDINAETAASMEIMGGTVSAQWMTVGRGNGSLATAPDGLQSELRINDGTVTATGIWLATRHDSMATLTARPLFEMNGGTLTANEFYGGSDNGGSARPRFVFNGGSVLIKGGGTAFRLARGAGTQSELVMNGGELTVSASPLRLADDFPNTRGTLRLNGGRLAAKQIERLGSSAGELYFNGGILAPLDDMVLSNLSATVVQSGGCVADVAAGLSLDFPLPLEHDAALGATPDGGVIKLGAGMLTLSGEHGYTGPTVVSGGVLRVSGSLASTDIRIERGALFSLADGSTQTFTPDSLEVNGGLIELEIAADGSRHDVLALPVNYVGGMCLRVVNLEDGAPFLRTGAYPLLTFSGAAPDISAWRVDGLDGAFSFEVDGAAIKLVIGVNDGADFSEWINTGDGEWSDTANWDVAPGGTADDNLLFGGKIVGPALIDTGGGANFGFMAVDSLLPYTWRGGALVLGTALTPGALTVTRGAHCMEAALRLPAGAGINLMEGAALQLNGDVAGAGALTVAGDGVLSVTNAAALDVPVTLDGATISLSENLELTAPFTAGSRGMVVTQAYGGSVTLQQEVAGSGGLTKEGYSMLELAGGMTFTGTLDVRHGVLIAPTLPAGPLTLGEGAFKYTGDAATLAQGYTIDTGDQKLSATLDSDADIEVSGQALARTGIFIKRGGGTLSYTYPGENWLSAGDDTTAGNTLPMELPLYGETPAGGFRSYNVFEGRVKLGAAGQTNYFSSAVVVGGATTAQPGAETAGHLEIDGGTTIFGDYLTVGRYNGTAVTAPAGLESSFTLNSGLAIIAKEYMGVWLGSMLPAQGTLTARPRFIINGGEFHAGLFYCGNEGGAARPHVEINAGLLRVGPHGGFNLGRAPGCQGTLEINGGTVLMTNQTLSLASDYAGARGTLKLNGGRLIANRVWQGGAGRGEIHFNGGVFQPSLSSSTTADIEGVIEAGGAFIEVPEGIGYAFACPLSGSGELVKQGAGVLALSSATNDYTGATWVSEGSLKLSGGGVPESSVTVDPNCGLLLQVPEAGQALGGLVLGATGAAEATLSITASAAAFTTGAVTVAGDLYLGPAQVEIALAGQSGRLPHGVYTLMTCSGAISGDVGGLRMADGQFDKSYTFAIDNGRLLLTVDIASSGAAVWRSAGGGSWSDASNWATAPGTGAVGLEIGFTEAIQTPSSINLADAAIAGTLFFANDYGYTLSGGGSLALEGMDGGSASIAVVKGTHTIDVPVESRTGIDTELASGNELHLRGAISGVGGIVKDGAGRLRLAGVNTYDGETVIEQGIVDTEGVSPFGAGRVLLKNNATGIASKDVATTVANDVDVYSTVYLGAYAPLALTGAWTAHGASLYVKVATNEMLVTGTMGLAADSTVRLRIEGGSVRFASGADVLFTHDTLRDGITFGDFDNTVPVRGMLVESGARVQANALYLAGPTGSSVTDTVEVAGGELLLHGGGDDKDALLLGVNNGGQRETLRISGGRLWTADDTWSIFGVGRNISTVEVGGGQALFSKVSLGRRDDTNYSSGSETLKVCFDLTGGLLEARERWNWMSDLNGACFNEVLLKGGRLRLPATHATVRERLNETRLLFDGGTLETIGGGTAPEDPADYLQGLKIAHVGEGGAVIKTQGRDVTLAQRLVGLDDSSGNIVKRGAGRLKLAQWPTVAGRLEAQAGTLQLPLDEGAPIYPANPILHLTFEDPLQDSSPYNHLIKLVGDAGALTAIEGVHGGGAVRLNGSNAFHFDYRNDLLGADSWTVSAWVRQSAYQSVNQNKTFFGRLDDYTEDAHDFLLRVHGGHFRWIGSGPDKRKFGDLYADVEAAVPLNTWVMLTMVADGLNGFSMYVNGERCLMKVYDKPDTVYTESYGAGQRWLLVGRTGGRAFNVGSLATSDTDCFIGDLDDVLVYRRALSPGELALLYEGGSRHKRRAAAMAGAAIDLSGGTTAFAELAGAGQVANGTAVVTELLAPGDSPESAPGACLSFMGGLTLADGVKYECDWAPAANDLADVRGRLTIEGGGVIDLGLTEPEQMPGAPRLKVFPVAFYDEIEGAEHLGGWSVTGTGVKCRAGVKAEDGAVLVTLEVFGGTLMLLR